MQLSRFRQWMLAAAAGCIAATALAIQSEPAHAADYNVGKTVHVQHHRVIRRVYEPRVEIWPSCYERYWSVALRCIPGPYLEGPIDEGTWVHINTLHGADRGNPWNRHRSYRAGHRRW